MYNRIVSLAPSITETIFALGCEQRLVGLTDYCNYPPQTKSIATIDGFVTPNVEKIKILSPDLILATTLHKDDKLRVFQDQGIEVIQIKAVTLFDAPDLIRSMGNILGKENEAGALADRLNAEMQSVLLKGKTITDKVKVCYLCTSTPFCAHKLKCQTNHLVSLLGGTLCGADGNRLAESIINDNPDVLIIPYKEGSTDYRVQKAFIDHHPELMQLQFFKQGRFKIINGELLSRPGPRAAEGLNILFNTIHNYQ